MARIRNRSRAGVSTLAYKAKPPIRQFAGKAHDSGLERRLLCLSRMKVCKAQAVGLLLVVSCQGSVEMPAGPNDPNNPNYDPNNLVPQTQPQEPIPCGDGIAQAGAERIYRLTPNEYTNIVRTLFSDDALAPQLDVDRELIATGSAVRKWQSAAQAVVPNGSDWTQAYVACDIDTTACQSELFEAFAERAFRRPLLEDEKVWLSDLAASMPVDASSDEVVKAVTEVLLQTPQFLYVYAEGSAVPDSPHALRELRGYERAQRLSLFLWDSLPDTTLLEAARSGALDAPDGMRTQAERMLVDDRAKPVLREFLVEWLELNGATILPTLEQTPKSSDIFPEVNDALRSAMRREVEALMDYVMFEADGSLETLLTSTRAYVNGPLAKLYGVAGGPTTESDWRWVDLDPNERAGMLTRAGFLTVHAAQTETSPIRRGVYMLTEVLCVNLPSPPANVDNTPIDAADLDPEEVSTVRKATELRTGSDACTGCHTQINELGFAFENFDAIGKWQEQERVSGAPIDASANLSSSGEATDGPVDGALELSARLAKSPAVAACMSERWFETALKRSPVELDACTVETLNQNAAASANMRDAILDIVTSDAFLHVNRGPTAGDLQAEGQ